MDQDKDKYLQIIEYIKNNRTEKQFILKDFNVTDMNILTLVLDLLKSNKNLHTLSLINCCIGPNECIDIVRSVNETKTLHTLDLSHNNIKHGVFELCDMLKNNTSIHILNVENCGINDERMFDIVNMLSANTTLDTLNLSCNEIDSDGILQLFKTLQFNTSLHVLNISWNIADMTIDADIEFVNFLCENTTLHTLSYHTFRIGSAMIDEIAKKLDSDYSLTTIVFSIKNDQIIQLVKRNTDIAQIKKFKITKHAAIDF